MKYKVNRSILTLLIVFTEIAPSELEQPKKECDYKYQYQYGNGMKTRCSIDEDCKQCSDCPNGANCRADCDPDDPVWCDFESGPICQCDDGFAG